MPLGSFVKLCNASITTVFKLWYKCTVYTLSVSQFKSEVKVVCPQQLIFIVIHIPFYVSNIDGSNLA